MPDNDKTLLQYFALFNEIAIIGQLSRAVMDAHLPAGLTTAHFSILNHLIRVRDGPTPLELARSFQVAKTTMTHTLTGLQNQRLIDMRDNPDDGRSKQVWLTPAGRQLRDQTIRELEPDLLGFSASLSAERLAALTSELGEIRQIMDSARNQKN